MAGPGEPDEPAKPSKRLTHRRAAGVSVIAGGLLQDLEERMRRELAPIEERVRPGEETRATAGEPELDGAATGREAEPAALVIVLPLAPTTPPVAARRGVPDEDRQ